MNENLLIKCIKKEPIDQLPVWVMRQAGRYLPEYLKIRAKHDNFVEFCLTPKAAAEVTLQPIERFNFDAAILFADILLVPFAMGQNVHFEKNIGPVLDDLDNLEALLLTTEAIEAVYETIGLIKDKLPPEKALIGFCGGLWSVACYMVHGRGKEGFGKALEKIKHKQGFMEALFKKLEIVTIDYLLGQAKAGVDVLKIFESHAGVLEDKDFDRWVIEPTARIIKAVKDKYPDLPVIGFPRGASLEGYSRYAKETGVDVLALDCLIDRREVLRECPNIVVQGNLDPHILVEGGEALERGVREIKKDFGNKHIFNLGHGVLPTTPLENVARLVELVRE